MKDVHVWLLACILLALVGALNPASASESSEKKLRQLMLQQRQSAGISATSVPSAERLQERTLLLKKGESALVRLEVDSALQAFERAALILHAADTEIALVRAYMQGGEYRRALAFGAHTAGAHLDVIGGSALYAWLLYIGGQPAIAQRLLSEVESRSPDKPLIKTVQQQLASGLPRAGHATPALLTLPTRLAPYGSGDALPAWPVLHSGFLGGVSTDGLKRQLWIDLAAGKHGGPVFDSGGRLIGLALQGKNVQGDTFMPMSRLNEEMRKLKVKNPTRLLALTEAQTSAVPRSSVDLIYESSLKTSLQVIGVP